MYKKICVLLLILTTPVFAGPKFFIEGGIGSRYLNGTTDFYSPYSNYTSDFELYRGPIDNTSSGITVTDNSSMGWKSKFLYNFSGAIGFNFSEKFVTTFAVNRSSKEGGFRQPAREYPNINEPIGENVERNSISTSPYATNWFSQMNLRITQSIHIVQSISFIGGFEYSFLKYEIDAGPSRLNNSNVGLDRNPLNSVEYNESTNRYIYKDNTLGFLAGFGVDLPLSDKTSLNFTGLYSFSSYKGDDLYFSNLDFDLGGIEFGYSLRYYLK